MQLNATHETNTSISFLDLLIIRNTENLETDIYRKPTTTDTTINFTSNQSMEYRTAAYRYNISRMHSIPLTSSRKQKEWTTMQAIAQNNDFPQRLIQRLNYQIQRKRNNEDHK